ncbi:MAG: hypothetical protein ACR2GW_09470 [Pyrinomonadaceae bacterium]
MADGGVLSRLGNLWRGFLRLWISDIEKDHPEIAYENAIDSMIEKYTKLKLSAPRPPKPPANPLTSPSAAQRKRNASPI